jgi:1,4-dihydroxy-2-naphthoate octaprenyltransferase
MLLKINSFLFSKSTWVHLRIPYSLCLAPVYFFALSDIDSPDIFKSILIFIILHLFLYPASQGYNSYYDQDKKSIGGIEKPTPVKKETLKVSFLFDSFALVLSLLIGEFFFYSIFICSLASKAYSHPYVRLKKHPWISWLTVAFFQGPFIYFNIYIALKGDIWSFWNIHWVSGLSTAFLFGGAYPMTQIFQHEEDEMRGDKTLSLKLGIKGTFFFSGLSFLIGNILLFIYFREKENLNLFALFQIFLFPVIIYFLYWFILCLKDEKMANFKRCMKLNILSTLSFSSFFIFLIFR